ncbi:MAG: methyltransferase [Acidobacteriota bacterium]
MNRPNDKKWARRFWRLFVLLQFELFRKRRLNRIVLETIAGRPILVLPRVFNPKIFFTGEFLADHLDRVPIPAGASVLDMGTGTGAASMVAALHCDRIVAVDLNPAAVRCARINALLNRVEDRVEVREGNLFGPVGEEKFDVVLFNPPYLAGCPSDALDQALRSDDIGSRFASQLEHHLETDGHALVVLSSVGERASFLSEFRSHNLAAKVVAERDLGSEVLELYRVSPETVLPPAI